MILKPLTKLVFILGASLSLTGNAIADMGTLRFATMNLEPYGFDANQDNRRGLFQKLHAAIAERAGFRFTDTVLPIKRAIKQINLGVSDCGIMLRTGWMEDNLDQIAEIKPKFESIIVSRPGFTINTDKDLDGHSLAIPRGSFEGYYIHASPLITRYFTNGYAHSSRLLKAGRVDAIAGSAVSLIYNMRQQNLTTNDVGSIVVFDETPLWLHCTRGIISISAGKRLRDAVTALRNEGFIDRLFTIHLASNID